MKKYQTIKGCIICDKDFQEGDIAPKEWCICINCLHKGFMVCEEDKIVFNKNSVIKSNLVIDKIHTLKVGSYDLLQDVIRSLNFQYENICSKDCYNLHYINKCIEKIQVDLNMIWMEESMPIFRNIVTDNKNREIYKNTLTNKIIELENCKQEYLR